MRPYCVCDQVDIFSIKTAVDVILTFPNEHKLRYETSFFCLLYELVIFLDFYYSKLIGLSSVNKIILKMPSFCALVIWSDKFKLELIGRNEKN